MFKIIQPSEPSSTGSLGSVGVFTDEPRTAFAQMVQSRGEATTTDDTTLSADECAQFIRILAAPARVSPILVDALRRLR
jgi:hypothetical protein